VGTADDAGPDDDGDGDLDRADRLRIEAHLDECADCREQRSALARSTALLSAAAVEMPVEPHAPSLWRGVEARIEASQASRPAIGARVARAVVPAPARTLADRATDRLDRVREGLPFRFAWARDTAFHDLPDRWRDLLDRASRPSARLADRIIGALASPSGLGAAGLAAALVAALAVAQRSQSELEARMAAQSAPIPIELQAVPLVLAPSRGEALEAESRAMESESVPDDEPEALAQNAAPLQPPAPERPAAAKPAARVYDYDLERGIPMPPDARTGKPAY
jgi:hypothetical protein